MSKFEDELRSLINRHSMENGSNTPDFILMEYLMICLGAFNTAVQLREIWYGRDPRQLSLFSDTSDPMLVTPICAGCGTPVEKSQESGGTCWVCSNCGEKSGQS